MARAFLSNLGLEGLQHETCFRGWGCITFGKLNEGSRLVGARYGPRLSQARRTRDRGVHRLTEVEGLDKLDRRKEIVEHPFGTMKRAFNQGYLLLKGLRKLNGEVGFTVLAYNMRRAISILGTKKLISSPGAAG